MAITNQFIRVKTKENFQALVDSGEIQDTSIAFIEDTSEIWAQGTYYPCIDQAEDVSIKDSLGYFDSNNVEDALVEIASPLTTHLANNTSGLRHVPSGGSENKLLAWDSEGTAKWESVAELETSSEDLLAYGVEWDTSVSDPVCTRIGSSSLAKSLPIQSGMYGCICQGTTIRYKLDSTDWRFMASPTSITVDLTVDDDGVITIVADTFSTLRYEKQWIKINDFEIQIDSIDTDTSTATLVNNDYTSTLQSGSYTCVLGSVRNGYDGTVRVYVPGFYYKSETEDTICRVYVSTSEIDSTYSYQQPLLIDAYKCTVLNTVPENMGYLSTLTVNSLVSIVNTNSYCRGGGNRSAYDAYLETNQCKSDLGKPRSNVARSTMRTRAKLTGDHLLSYTEYKNVFYWLYLTEYANFNSQATYYSNTDDNGYKQGGLGSGVTTMNSNVWSSYNSSYSLIPCGYLDYYGNGNGVYALVLDSFDLTITPTVSNWSSWSRYTYTSGTHTYNYTTSTRSGAVLTVTNVAKTGNEYYTSSLYAAGSMTYTVSGLEDGQYVQFSCSGQTTVQATEDGAYTMDWGTDGSQTRCVGFYGYTGDCNLVITCTEVESSVTASYPSQTVTVNRWRGFDCPFGDIWTNLDGVIVSADTDNQDGVDWVYTCDDPDAFADTITDDYKLTGTKVHTAGYVKAFNLGDDAQILPSAVGGSSTTYMCDYHQAGDSNTTLRTLRVGGYAYNGGAAGLGYLYSNNSVSSANAPVGFRAAAAL